MRPISRRGLIGASLAPVVFAGSAAAQRTPASEKVRLGLVGCGGISRSVTNAFLAHPECELVSICDVDDAMLARTLKRLEELNRPQPAAVKDYRRVVERKDIDVVLVCTPDHWHALPAIDAMQAGKDIYVEKPLATSLKESRAVRDAARATGRKAQMGTHWRSGPHYAEAVEMVRAGKIGKVRQVRCFAYLDWVTDCGTPPDSDPPPGVAYDMWLGPAPLRPFNKNRFHFNFRWFWDYAGGLMTDWGVHLINIALWAMGEQWPRSIVSSGGKYVLTDNTETPDTQIAVYEFPGYTLIWEHQVQCGLGPDRREHAVVFTGTDATLIVDTSGWELIAEPKKRTTVVEMKRRAVVDEKVRVAHAKDLLEAVKTGRQPVENLEVGHHVTAVSLLGNVALRARSRIEWDAQEEKVVGNEQANQLLWRPYRAPWKLSV